MKAVVNASPLIFLTKLDRLALLPNPCGTTPAVLDEVRAGVAQGHPEAVAVEALVATGALVVRDAKPSGLAARAGLHAGEASMLQLAVDAGVGRVIVDDSAAIRTAKLLGLAPVSTPFLFLEARRAGAIDAPEFRRLLERLVAHRYFLSAPIFQRLLDAGADAVDTGRGDVVGPGSR